MAQGKGKIKGWFTRNGVHIPIYEDYTVRKGPEPENVKGKFKGKKMKPSDFKDKTVEDLWKHISKDYKSRQNMRELFDLKDATDAQLDSLKYVFNGMKQYDTGYDEKRTPYKIRDLQVKELEGRKYDKDDIGYNGRKSRDTHSILMVSITTVPDTESAYLRMADEKYRHFLIGANGGYYTYRDKGNSKKRLSDFSVAYGGHDGKGYAQISRKKKDD